MVLGCRSHNYFYNEYLNYLTSDRVFNFKNLSWFWTVCCFETRIAKTLTVILALAIATAVVHPLAHNQISLTISFILWMTNQLLVIYIVLDELLCCLNLVIRYQMPSLSYSHKGKTWLCSIIASQLLRAVWIINIVNLSAGLPYLVSCQL